MSIFKQIIEGHINEFRVLVGTSPEEVNKIYKARAKVCIQCPLKNGNTCNPSLSINPKTLETAPTVEKKIGFIKGCGCRLSAKQKSHTTSCPAGFWGGEFNNKNK